MNPEFSKNRSPQKQNAPYQDRASMNVKRELNFQSPEELIRFDASQVTPPESIKARLSQSMQQQSPPKKTSWWSWLLFWKKE